MATRQSAPRTIGGVLDDAITLYRRSIRRVWPLTLAAALLLAVPAVVMRAQLADAKSAGPQAVLAVMQTSSYWLNYAALVLIYIGVYGALVLTLDGIAKFKEVSVGDALMGGLRLLVPMIVVGVLFFLVILLGSILLIIPGIYLWGVFQLVFVALIVERAGILESFGISRRLIKGYWWRSATIITVAFIIVLVFSILVALVNAAAIGVFGVGSLAATALQTILNGALNMVLIPLFPCFLLALYYDLKVRHEGGDLAARVDALAPR